MREMREFAVCDGVLRFHASHNVDWETVALLLNSTSATSPADCTQQCYRNRCGFAYFDTDTKTCQYTVNTEDFVDHDCHYEEEDMYTQYDKGGKMHIICMECIAATTTEGTTAATLEESTTAETINEDVTVESTTAELITTSEASTEQSSESTIKTSTETKWSPDTSESFSTSQAEISTEGQYLSNRQLMINKDQTWFHII